MSGTARIYGGWLLAFDALLLAGGFAAASHWRPAAFLMIGGLLGLLAAHLAIGVVGYRRVMRRPWPQVAPLADDED